ncbi:hypothetical protein KIPB_013442, partial [Kipferlia bialata]|eukprot:g13442.t1
MCRTWYNGQHAWFSPMRS